MSIISSFNILLVLMILAQTSQTYNNREMAGLYVGKTLWYQTSTELVLYPNGDYLFRKDNITSEGKWKVENQGVILTPFNGEKIRIHQFEYESISFEIITRKKCIAHGKMCIYQEKILTMQFLLYSCQSI